MHEKPRRKRKRMPLQNKTFSSPKKCILFVILFFLHKEGENKSLNCNNCPMAKLLKKIYESSFCE